MDIHPNKQPMQSPLNAHNKQEYPPMHTAEHVLNQTMIRIFGCPRSRTNHIERKKSKCDYLLSQAPTPQQVAQIEAAVNAVLQRNLPITMHHVLRSEAPPTVDLSKLPADVSDTLRLVRVGDYDECPCIGAHVDNTSQVGTFKIVSTDYADGRFRLRFKLIDCPYDEQ